MLSESLGSIKYESQHSKNWIEHQNATLQDLVKVITRAYWSPILWVPRVRKESNFHCASWLALDFDGTRTIADVDAECLQMGWPEFVLAPTRSHQRAKLVRKPDGTQMELAPTDRFRLVAAFEKPIWDLHVFKHSMLQWARKMNADTVCCSGAQGWRPSRAAWLVKGQGNKRAEVYEDVPDRKTQEEVDAETEAKRAKVAAGIIPRSVALVLDGTERQLIGKYGSRNKALYCFAADLFVAGWDYLRVFSLASQLPWFQDAGGPHTLRSAAKNKGVPYM
jgi:hypothetical protein